jgi:alkylation response protein AidB-like acyl-CoA dehydrogenase
MNLDFTETQKALKNTARKFLDQEYPLSMVRQIQNDSLGYSPSTFFEMGKLGWLDLAYPEKYGGLGGNILDYLVLLEQIGRSLLVSPLISSNILCGRLIIDNGNEQIKTRILKELGNGSKIAALAYAEGQTTIPVTLDSTIQSNGTNLLLTGLKYAVPFGFTAQYYIVGATYQSRTVLALVSPESNGVKIEHLPTVGNFPRTKVQFENVLVPDINIFYTTSTQMENAMNWATLAQCAEMVGRADKILEMCLEYCHNRVQFGRPIGTFQAIQHQCADLSIAIQAARLHLYRAGCAVLDSSPNQTELTSMTKAICGDMSKLSTKTGHGIFAGISFTLEHPMQLYSEHNKLAEAAFGNTMYHTSAIGKLLIG